MRKTPMNGKKKRLLIAWVTLLIAWITMTMIPLITLKTGRILADYHDRALYFDRGKWLIDNTPQISEYPQIPTTLFGITHIVSMWLDASLQRIVFINFFSLEMILVLFLAFKVLLELLPPDRVNYAYLLLLPPTIYFSYNRFDILPAFLCMLAYSASVKRQWILASTILAIATFTKWYPALLFPGFFMYATSMESKFQWKMILSFSITCLVILLLSYLQGGTEALVAPYQFHMSRSMENIALPVLIDGLLHRVISIDSTYYFLFFFVIQISGPILVLLTRLDSLDALAHYCIIAVGVFILFSRIWSPQWFLWLIPFLIISARSMKDVNLIIAYNLMTYLCFPILFDFYGYDSYRLLIPGLLSYCILVTIILRSTRNLRFSMAFPLTRTGDTRSAQHAVDSGDSAPFD